MFSPPHSRGAQLYLVKIWWRDRERDVTRTFHYTMDFFKEKSCSTFSSPDTPGSPEGNTEGPGTPSSEPLLPS